MLFQQGEKKKEKDVGNGSLLLNRNNSSEAPNFSSNHPSPLSGITSPEKEAGRRLGEVSNKERKAELIYFLIFNIVSEALETLTGPGASDDAVRFKGFGGAGCYTAGKPGLSASMQASSWRGALGGGTGGLCPTSHLPVLPGPGTPRRQNGVWTCPGQLQPPSPRRGGAQGVTKKSPKLAGLT